MRAFDQGPCGVVATPGRWSARRRVVPCETSSPKDACTHPLLAWLGCPGSWVLDGLPMDWWRGLLTGYYSADAGPRVLASAEPSATAANSAGEESCGREQGDGEARNTHTIDGSTGDKRGTRDSIICAICLDVLQCNDDVLTLPCIRESSVRSGRGQVIIQFTHFQFALTPRAHKRPIGSPPPRPCRYTDHFHGSCIRPWQRLKGSCPVCLTQFSTRPSEPVSLLNERAIERIHAKVRSNGMFF